jgi:hypothetical protein
LVFPQVFVLLKDPQGQRPGTLSENNDFLTRNIHTILFPEAQNLFLKDIFNVKHTPNMEKH